MKILRALPLFAMCFALPACADPGASLEVDDIRASRLPDGRVAVDVDVLAQERLGGRLPTYCARVTFPDEPTFEEYKSDLEDGDRKTLRYTSKNNNIAPKRVIAVELLVDRAAVRSTVEAP